MVPEDVNSNVYRQLVENAEIYFCGFGRSVELQRDARNIIYKKIFSYDL